MPFASGRQRALLWSFIASIALCAVTGIYCLLLDSWGMLQERVLGTTGAIAFASIAALASTVPWERRVWHPLGPAGCVIAAITLVMFLLAIWTDADRNETFTDLLIVFATSTITVPVIGLLGLARLRRSYAWAQAASVLAVVAYQIMVIVLIFFDPDGDWWNRWMGIVGILAASGLIATPVLHRISGLPTTRQSTDTSDRITLTCPRCGASQSLPIGQSTCSECGLGFRIGIDS